MLKGWHAGWLWAETSKSSFENEENYVDRAEKAAKGIYGWNAYVLDTTFEDAVSTWCDLNERAK
jgi:hypothetical protein